MKTKQNIVTASLAWAALAVATASHAQPNFTKITNGPFVGDGENCIGAAWVDFDGDGDLDLYVADNQSPVCLLYRNDGQGAFTKITTGPLVNTGQGARGAAWADLDNDGRMDLFLATTDGPGWLFHQGADGTCTRSSLNTGASFAGAWADYDNDGCPDLFVAQSRRSIVWHNDGQGGLGRTHLII